MLDPPTGSVLTTSLLTNSAVPPHRAMSCRDVLLPTQLPQLHHLLSDLRQNRSRHFSHESWSPPCEVLRVSEVHLFHSGSRHQPCHPSLRQVDVEVGPQCCRLLRCSSEVPLVELVLGHAFHLLKCFPLGRSPKGRASRHVLPGIRRLLQHEANLWASLHIPRFFRHQVDGPSSRRPPRPPFSHAA